MHLAKYEILEDGQYFGEIPGFQGVLRTSRTFRNLSRKAAERLGGLACAWSVHGA